MSGGIMYNQRDIVLIPFPYTDLTGTKQRPALILSNSNSLSKEDKICCLVTSKKSREGIEITKTSYDKGELPFKSWIKPHRVFTIHEKIVRKRICTVTPEFCSTIVNELEKCIKLEEF